MRLSETLAENRRVGRPSLVVYITGGLPDTSTTTRLIEAVAVAGADAVELGIPFSDPIMDGPVIQAASQAALDAGANPPEIIEAASSVADALPVGFMTYANVVGHAGWRRFAQMAADAGMCAGIIPDLPLEEADEWLEAAAGSGIEAVMFAAPTSPDERIVANAAVTGGFLYAVGTMGVTGERRLLASTAGALATRAKSLTDKAVLIGVGVSNVEQAKQACEAADGVVVGTSVVRRILEAASADDAVEEVSSYVAELRAGLDTLAPAQPVPDVDCDLCEAATMTTRFFSDDLCWIADCESCDVPMVVWNHHGKPSTADAAAMAERLRRVAQDRYAEMGVDWQFDREQRQIVDHWHVHARGAWSS